MSVRLIAVFAIAIGLQGATLVLFYPGVQALPPGGGLGAESEILAVVSSADNGEGTLRWAIDMSNQNPGPDEIVFNLSLPVTITLFSALPPITGSLTITGPMYVTDTAPLPLTLDGRGLGTGEPMMVLMNSADSRVSRIRMLGASNGFALQVEGISQGTSIVTTTVEGGYGGVYLQGAEAIKLEGMELRNLVGPALRVAQSRVIRFADNEIMGAEIGIDLLGGVEDVAVISNTLSNLSVAGIRAGTVAGVPSPVGVQIRRNSFAGTQIPILFGTGTNRDLPAPQIEVGHVVTTTLTIGVRSPASPDIYPYPLSVELYRVVDGSYFPAGEPVTYTAEAYPNPITATLDMVSPDLGDRVAAVATDAEWNSSIFSQLEILPIELLDFSAQVSDDRVHLTWTSASERNNKGFEIQVAEVDQWLRLSPYVPIGFAPGAGTTVVERSYSFGTDRLAPGTYRFRLKQIDLDGNAFHSDGVEVTVLPSDSHVLGVIYPNPFSDRARISLLLSSAQRVRLDLFDLSGRRVATFFDGFLEANRVSRFALDSGGLASGTYFVRASGERFSDARQVVIQQ